MGIEVSKIQNGERIACSHCGVWKERADYILEGVLDNILEGCWSQTACEDGWRMLWKENWQVWQRWWYRRMERQNGGTQCAGARRWTREWKLEWNSKQGGKTMSVNKENCCPDERIIDTRICWENRQRAESCQANRPWSVSAYPVMAFLAELEEGRLRILCLFSTYLQVFFLTGVWKIPLEDHYSSTFILLEHLGLIIFTGSHLSAWKGRFSEQGWLCCSGWGIWGSCFHGV